MGFLKSKLLTLPFLIKEKMLMYCVYIVNIYMIIFLKILGSDKKNPVITPNIKSDSNKEW